MADRVAFKRATTPRRVRVGNAPATIALPVGVQVHHLLVMVTDGGQLAVTLPQQPTDELPTDLPYDENFAGGIQAIAGDRNVVIDGDVDYWRLTTDEDPA